MSRPRFSIAGLMALVVFLAVGLAALVRSSRLWAATLFTLAMAALIVAILGAIHDRGPRRAFWSGCVVAGGLYWLVHFGPWFYADVAPYTLPRAALDLLYAELQRTSTPATVPPMAGGTSGSAGGMMQGGMMRSQMMGSSMMAMMGGGPPPAPPREPWDSWTDRTSGGAWELVRTPEAFLWVGHCLIGVPCAVLGGLVASRFARRGGSVTIDGAGPADRREPRDA